MAAEEPPPAVVMNPLDATLDILLRENGTVCSKHSEAGYGYLSGGCRANVGLLEGKAHFKVRMLQALLSSDDLPVTHTACIGVSWADAPVQQLGEADHTWGYSGTGEKASGGACMPYAEPFGPGDEIVCILDLTAAEPTLTFAKNGTLLGVAHKLPRPSGPAQAFFPHVLIKNIEVKLDFGGSNASTSSTWQDKPHDCPSWQAAVNGGAKRVVIPSTGVACNECEVLMLVGLPGTGKTTWARQRAEKLPARRYITLGTDLVMEQMKVPGLQLQAKRSSAGGFHGEAGRGGLDVATLVLQSLLDRAPAVPRNYILDQRNVDESARKRRLAPFLRAGFTCRAIVFITPDRLHFGRQRWLFNPEDRVVTDEALAEMKANFSIPVAGPEFKEVTFVEDSGAIAAQVVKQQRAAGRAWLDWHKLESVRRQSVNQGQEQERATQVRKLQPGMTPRGHGAPLPSEPPGCGQVPPSGQGLSAAPGPRMVPDWPMLLQSFPEGCRQGRGLYGQRQLGSYPGQQWQGPIPGQQWQGPYPGQQWQGPHPGQQWQGPFGRPFPGPYGQQWSGPCPGQQWQGPYGQLQQGPYGQLQQGSYGQQWPGPYPGMQGPYGQQGQGSNPGLQRSFSGQQWQGPYGQLQQGPYPEQHWQGPYEQQWHGPYPGLQGQGPYGQQGQGTYGQQGPYVQQGQGTYGQQWLGPDGQQGPYPGMQGQGYHPGQQGQWGQQDCGIGSKVPGSASGGAAGGAGAAGRPAAEESLEDMELVGARQGGVKQGAAAKGGLWQQDFGHSTQDSHSHRTLYSRAGTHCRTAWAGWEAWVGSEGAGVHLTE